MMSEVVSQVTWQRWKACDLGNNNHIAQAPLVRAKEPPRISKCLLTQGNEPTTVS